MRSGDERMTRDGAGEPQADWAPPFIPADDAGGGRAGGFPSGGRANIAAAPSPVAWYVPFFGRLLMLMAIGLLVAAFFGGIFGISETVSKSTESSVPITISNPTIHIDSAVSKVRVVPIPAGDAAKANAVTVMADTEVRHFSRFLAQRSLDVAPLTPEVRDGEVYIDTQPDDGEDFFFERNTDVTVYVPANAALDLRLRFGSARVTGLTGQMTVDLSGGTLRLVDVTLNGQSRLEVHGGNFDLVNVTLNGQSDFLVNGGNIDLDGTLGTDTALNVEVNGGNADIRLPLRTDARLDATADGGSLDVEGWSGGVRTFGDPGVNRIANGYLSNDQTTTNRITLRLNGGNLSLRPATLPAPSGPSGPPAPPAR